MPGQEIRWNNGSGVPASDGHWIYLVCGSGKSLRYLAAMRRANQRWVDEHSFTHHIYFYKGTVYTSGQSELMTFASDDEARRYVEVRARLEMGS